MKNIRVCLKILFYSIVENAFLALCRKEKLHIMQKNKIIAKNFFKIYCKKLEISILYI